MLIYQAPGTYSMNHGMLHDRLGKQRQMLSPGVHTTGCCTSSMRIHILSDTITALCHTSINHDYHNYSLKRPTGCSLYALMRTHALARMLRHMDSCMHVLCMYCAACRNICGCGCSNMMP